MSDVAMARFFGGTLKYLLAALALLFLYSVYRHYNNTRYVKCTFDRNDPGPIGQDGHQWWYDVYKCPDGTERRFLVAGPRG